MAVASAAAALINATAAAATATVTATVVPEDDHPPKYSVTQMVFIGTVTAVLSLITVVGNIMVMISFKIDKQLQTISNYFLFSLAVADFAIGLISMPLFTVSTLVGYWPLGPHVCDTWLALDYLASNASVLNLLIISFDRYFSVTRPLTYRVRRTTNKAAVMIGCAWGISLLLWPPWIYSWPYIEGERTVPDDQCYIQFIETNHYITFGTAIAAFYVPVSVMCFLYWRIWCTTKRRQKDLPNLQAGKKDSSRRSNSSADEQAAAAAAAATAAAAAAANAEDWPSGRARSESAADAESVTPGGDPLTRRTPRALKRVRAWCVAWYQSGREDSDTEDESPSEQNAGCATPVSVETPLQSSVSRCTSLNVIRDPYAIGGGGGGSGVSGASAVPCSQLTTPTRQAAGARDSRSLPAGARLAPPPRSVSTDSVYTILIRLPADPPLGDPQPTIRMIAPAHHALEDGAAANHHHVPRRPSAAPDVRIPLNAKIIPKQLAGKAVAGPTKHLAKKKKKPQEKKADKKAAKTLSAILLTFIITWTPYNILVLLKPVTSLGSLIPPQLWDFFYYLCYINSTINPMCYALCNASFRRTYLRILQCKWHNRNRAAINRGYYN